MFLKRCVSHNLLLPSNRQKNVDFDLLLIQQSRKISKDLRSIIEQIKNLHPNLVSGNAFSVTEERNKAKIRYIKRFNWLWNKQKSMNNTGLKKNTTFKNRKDRLKYKKTKKFKLKNQKIQKANEMILNKSTITLSDDDKLFLIQGFAPKFCSDSLMEL